MLVLVRHGQSLYNKAGMFTGLVDAKLSIRGVEEAQSTGRDLKELGIRFNAAVREQINRDRITLDTVERLRAQADTVFIDGMKAADPNIPNWKISACYRSVRIFGRWGVRKKSSALVDTP